MYRKRETFTHPTPLVVNCVLDVTGVMLMYLEFGGALDVFR